MDTNDFINIIFCANGFGDLLDVNGGPGGLLCWTVLASLLCQGGMACLAFTILYIGVSLTVRASMRGMA